MPSRSATIIIQSRLASTRLPAKAVLPIAGLASVLLCARRAANTGLRVIVATSSEKVDDPIADLLRSAGVTCVRGSHEDVLKRFAQATDTMAADDVVVRLTADNVFPDGAFIDAMLQEYRRLAVDFLSTRAPQDGLPYGLSAEVFTVKWLRLAHLGATDVFDREHVTQWIIRHGTCRRYLFPASRPNWSRLRCTLDTFEDYRRLLRVFAGLQDPIGVKWTVLVERLAEITQNGHKARVPFTERADGSVCSVLTLGTAQFGMRYGIANSTGVPGDSQIGALLTEAVDAGVTALDTARAYGDSEEKIGQFLSPGDHERIKIITKLDVFAEIPDDAAPSWVRSAVDASVFRSSHALHSKRIDTLLLHRWAHRHAWSGAVWARLRDLQRMGVVGVIGASVSTPVEAMAALQDQEVGHLQCPVNLLDWRWRSDDFLRAVQARPDVVIHARSALLQGLLTLPAKDWISVPGADATVLCDALDGLVQSLGRIDRTDLCIAYVRAMPWVTSVVLGMESAEQLRHNLELIQAPPLIEEEVWAVASRIPRLPEALLNPSLWRSSNG